MSSNNEIITMLTIVLGVMIAILVILCMIFLALQIKNKKQKKPQKEILSKNKKSKLGGIQQKSIKEYSKDSIFKFMEFDNIVDNMITQKDDKRFLMVLECQGINFDLMSGLEKNSVEQGFVQFLNTLRYPIQIYVQTRTVNLGSSIGTYKERVDNIAKEYRDKQIEFNQKVRSGRYEMRELDKENYELIRQRNLFEYGIDIVNNTEKMSLNKNILSKHYYIIIPHYSDLSPDQHYDKDEISNIAFSELYTKAQTIASSLAVCGINSKLLDSIELAELLYNAYNRDESETFDLQKAMRAGYEDMYSTAPNVLDKRMAELDIKIEQEATIRANEAVYAAIEEDERQRRVKQKEEDLDNLIDEMAKALVEENKRSLGADIAVQAIKKIDSRGKENSKEEEGGE